MGDSNRSSTGKMLHIPGGLETKAPRGPEDKYSVAAAASPESKYGSLSSTESMDNPFHVFANWLDQIREHKEHANQLILRITIPPEHVQQYLILQEAISKLIPDEYKRPTIEITIKGSGRPLKDMNGKPLAIDAPDLGLLGGTGPLSDAHIITKLVRQITQPEFVHIKLRSAPPPRPEEKKLSILAWSKHMWRYVWGVKSFGASRCNHYAMLSNTAHANTTNFLRMLDSPANFVHVVNHVACSVAKDNAKTVLILGTKEAKEKRLYPQALALYKRQGVFPEEKAQNELQTYIDLVKSNKEVDGKKFLDLIFKEIKLAQVESKANLSHVIFGCTEIPFFLESQPPGSPKDHTYLKELKAMIAQDLLLKDLPIKLVDTEKAMVDVLLHHTMAISKLKQEKASHFSSVSIKLADAMPMPELKASILRSIEYYISTAQGDFLHTILGKNQDKLDKASNWHAVFSAVPTQNETSIKMQLQKLCSLKRKSTSNSGIHVVILEGLLGSLPKAQRKVIVNQIAEGDFSEFDRRLIGLRATQEFRQSSKLVPGEVNLRFEAANDSPIAAPPQLRSRL